MNTDAAEKPNIQASSDPIVRPRDQVGWQSGSMTDGVFERAVLSTFLRSGTSAFPPGGFG